MSIMAGVAGCLIYSVWDNDNRLYGNIITGFLGSVFSFYLASSISGGNVISAGTDQIIQDGALSYLFSMIGVIMGLMVILMVVESLMLYKSEKRIALWGGNND